MILDGYIGLLPSGKLSGTGSPDVLDGSGAINGHQPLSESRLRLWQLRQVIGKNWGINLHIAYWLSSAIIRTRIQYGYGDLVA